MSLVGEQVLLRIYLQTADRSPQMPTHERVLKAARVERLAGATVLRGILGAGYHGVLRPSAWSITQHAPVIVEIVDSGDRIVRFIDQVLDRVWVGGMLTLERAAVALYRHRDTGTDRGSLRLADAKRPLSMIPHLPESPHMKTSDNGVLLRVFIGESDRIDGRPLYEAIVQKVRELGLAGATVLRGTEGFGANSVVHRAGLMEMSCDLPVIIEIVDSEEKIQLLLPSLETMVHEGMITMEYVTIVMYRHSQPSSLSVPPGGPDTMA